jgi:hypothetical protein
MYRSIADYKENKDLGLFQNKMRQQVDKLKVICISYQGLLIAYNIFNKMTITNREEVLLFTFITQCR